MRPEGRIVEHSQILANSMAGGQVRQTIRLIDSMLAVHIGAHEAAINREPFTADQTLGDATRHGRLEQLAQQITVTEAPVPVLGEGRVVGHIAFQPQAAEPAIGEVYMSRRSDRIPMQ